MKKVIWIEDDKELENIYGKLFKENEIDIAFASSIAKGMKLINLNISDYILLDIKFPQSPDEGYIFLEEILKHNPNLKIILLSSYIDENIAIELLESNKIIGYLNKPLINEKDLKIFFSKFKNLMNLNQEIPKFKIKTIKIFIASSDTLLEEREKIEQLLYRMTDSLIEEGIYLKTTIWEKLSKKFTIKSKQKMFNKIAMESDVFFCLIHDKVGRFTKEEFDEAFKNFRLNKTPSHMFVFFKDSPIQASKITRKILDVIQMKEEIQKYEQFYAHYKSIDELLNIVREEIDKYLIEIQ